MALLIEDVQALSRVPEARSSVRKLCAAKKLTLAMGCGGPTKAEVQAGADIAELGCSSAEGGRPGIRYKRGTMRTLKHRILGLHHVTATVDDAQADLDVYRGALGLRLLKKTVNFDNHNVYHFYYGDERGTPGTIWTTFPYKGWGVPPGRHGEGQITSTSFSVPANSLDFWQSRLDDAGVKPNEDVSSSGPDALSFRDPSGLVIRLVEEPRDERRPWTGNGIGTESAVRGLHSVRMTIGAPGPTLALMTQLLGFQVTGEAPGIIRLAVNGDLPGHRIELAYGMGAPPASNGLGTVHHVAMAIGSSEEQVALRQELIALGYAVTEVLDRQYFQSIYFREPGRVLFEVATVHPGFAVDEALPMLGRELKLPPWEEPNRAIIERGLPAIAYPHRD
jgi:glyoxalase family protein